MPSIPLMIFMGTPHRGLDTEALLELVKHDATAPLIRQISFRSHELNELNSDFCHFLTTAPDIAILSVYETIRTKTLVEVSKKLLPRKLMAHSCIRCQMEHGPDKDWKR